MKNTTTDELLNALDVLICELKYREMSKEQILDMTRMAGRLTIDSHRRIIELQGEGLWP